MIVDKGLIDFLNQKDAEKKLASNSFFAETTKYPYRSTTKANTPTSTTENISSVSSTDLSGSLFSGYTPISVDKSTTTPTKSTTPTLSGSLFTGYNSVSKPIIADKPAKKEPTWLDNLDTAVGGAIAESAVNTVRTLASFFERSKATQMGGVGSDFSEQAIKRGQQLMSGDIGQIFTAIGDTLKQSNPLSIIVPAITTAASPSAMKKTTATTKLLKPVETAIHTWSNIDNADAFTQTVAGGFGSIIPSLQALIPGGMALMFVESYENTWEQEYAKQLGWNGVSDDNIMLYSLGSAALNTAFEYMGQAALGLKGWAGKLFGKGTTNILAKSTVGQGINKIMQTTAGRLVAGSAEEGLEEVFTGITTGLLASVTVNPQKWDNIWSWEDNGVSNISAASLLKQFATGAIGGGVMGGARLTGKAISDTKQNKATELFTNLNAKIDSLSDQSEITQDDYFEIQQSAQEDMSNPKTQAYVTKAAALASSKIIELNNNGVNPFAKSDSPLFDGYTSPDAVSSAVGVSGTSSNTKGIQTSMPSAETPVGALGTIKNNKGRIKQPTEFYSLVRGQNNKPEAVKQEGKSVRIEAMPEGKFFVYSQQFGKKKSWYVIESTSGISISNQSTRTEAILQANNTITEKGITNINERITNTINKFGIMPSYKVQPTATAPNTTAPLGGTQQESELVKESKKADMSGVLNVVPKMFSDSIKTSTTVEPKWKQSISGKTREALGRASNPNLNQTPVEWLKERLSKFREFVTLGSVPVDVKEGDIRRLFREARTTGQYAKGQAENIIARSYNKAGKDKYELLKHAIVYLDIEGDIMAGLYKPDSMMMFDITSPSEALKTIKLIKEELNKPENALVQEAIDTRRKLMDEVREEVIAEGKKAGMDLRHIKAKVNYMYHAITEFREEFNAALKAKGSRTNSKRVEYLARAGSLKDYIADPIMSDYLILQKLIKDLAKLRLYNEIKLKDISQTLTYSKDTEWTIPVGYSELNPAMFGVQEYDRFDKKKMMEIQRAKLTERGTDPNSDKGKKTMARVASLFNRHVIVVPTQIVDAVVNEFGSANEKAIGRAAKKLINVWKYLKIRMPNAVIKYNTRNLFGDLDAVIIQRPSALKYVPTATKELFKYFYKGGILSANLQGYVRRSGMTTGQTPQELKTMTASKLINVFEQSNKTKDVVRRTVRKIWSMLTMETATQYREQILRYATYLSYGKEFQTNKTGLPKNSNYAASIPSEIQGIKNNLDRAYKMSNDLVGSYDDVSLFGQWAADHLMPFFRFTEVNTKRYYRIMKNSFYNDGISTGNAAKDAMNKSARIAKGGAFAILRASKVMLGVAMFYGALTLLNNVIAPDEEEELPEDVKNSPHITIPRWITGGDKIYYIDRLGSFSEFLNMIGIDYSLGSDLQDIATGRMKLSDKLNQIAMSPVSTLFNSSWPIAKIAFELITGKTYFPDPTKPAQIRDTWEYLFGQVGFKDEYKALAGKPIQDGSYFLQKRNVLFNSVLAGDSAFYDVYDMIDDFYTINNLSNTTITSSNKNTDKYRKAQSIYYYKQALKLGDANAAEKYLAEYIAYGGTKKTFNSSMEYLNPLNGMKSSTKADFLDWITPEQKETYDRAMEYYKELESLTTTTVLPTK